MNQTCRAILAIALLAVASLSSAAPAEIIPAMTTLPARIVSDDGRLVVGNVEKPATVGTPAEKFANEHAGCAVLGERTEGGKVKITTLTCPPKLDANGKVQVPPDGQIIRLKMPEKTVSTKDFLPLASDIPAR